MHEYLANYLKNLEEILKKDENIDYEQLLRDHAVMIGFMQHERLIHFLVTMLFVLGFFIVLGIYLVTQILMLLPLLLLILGLIVPYILHYYFLENSVQKMYKQYDEINRRCKASRAASHGLPRE
ncbi:MAG: hypothetical protein IK130_09725 [Oscillospiraceae bacterium]|nr:hypothetical protein [Oscillospiraceae bacterium]